MKDEPSRRRARQVIRMLGIVKALTEGGRVTVASLAARFGTTRQSTYRDLHGLEEIGVPVRGDAGGGYAGILRFAPGFRLQLPVAPFTRQELLALTWAAKGAGDRQPFGDVLSMALLKLQAMVDGRQADLLTALDGAVSERDRWTKDASAHQTTLLRLVEAIIGRWRCVLEYQAPGRDRPGRFPYDPYRLRNVQGGVYCLGRVPAYPKAFVTLALERIRDLRLTEESFTVDTGFDPKRYETEAFGVAWSQPMTVVLRFRADQAPYVRERQWHPTQRFRTLRDGRLEMTFRAGGESEILRWILAWGDAVEVLKPPRLRSRVTGICRATAVLYAGPKSVDGLK